MMDDKDFLNDPIFKNLRKFAEKEVVNVRLDEDIREAFRSASPKVSKAKIFRRSIYSVIGITIALPTLSYAHVLPKPIAKVVDTTGAGDLFAAGFLYGFTHGRDLTNCAKIGCMAAGEVISHTGARPEVSLKELLVKHGL